MSFTAEQIHDLLDPFIGDTRLGGELGTDAFKLHLPVTARRVVDEQGDDVAFVGHPIDARLMAAAPKLARQLLDLLEEN